MSELLENFWNDFNEYASKAAIRGMPMVFRGFGDKEFELIPSLGRGTFENTGGEISMLERDLLEEFKRLSIPMLKSEPLSEFEWLFLAQHYGLPTRLLDWSTNPMVALFFAEKCIFLSRRSI